MTIRQLLEPDAITIVSGRRSPRQGWVSERWGRVRPAPVVDARVAGRRVRYLTLLVPSAGARPSIGVRGLRLTQAGFSVVVQVDGQAERFSAGTGWVRVEPLARDGVSAR